MKQNYKKANYNYWQKGYAAPNVEPAIFRFYGKYLKEKYKKKLKLLDFGCGQGAAVNFFCKNKIDAYGVDISKTDISKAKKKYKKIKNKFFHIENLKDINKLNIKNFDVITCVQSLYYLSNSDLKSYLIFFKSLLVKNGILYSTMITTKSSLFNNKAAKNGLSLVNKDNEKKIRSHYINFTHSYKDLKKKFKIFKVTKTGYYSFCLDKNNDINHHYTIIAKK